MKGTLISISVDTEGGGLFPVQDGVGTKQVEGEQEQEVTSPLYHQLLTRAAEALGIDMPAEQGQRTSRFDGVDTTQSQPFTVPLLPDVEDLVLIQFLRPAEAHRCSGLCRRLTGVHGRERIGCGPPPPIDQALGALIFPTKSVLRTPSCPSINTKMMDAMFNKLHGAMAVQGQLVNTGAILALYQRQLASQLADNSGLAAEVQQVSSLLV